MVAARKAAHVLASHRLRHVASKQHHGDQTDLIDVVAPLPSPNFSPSDLIRHMKQIERISGNPARIQLMSRNSKVADLQLLVFANKDIEGRQVAMQRLSAVQCVECAKYCRNLTAHESLRL